MAEEVPATRSARFARAVDPGGGDSEVAPLDTSAMLDRLERQAADLGKLTARLSAAQRALQAERKVRRRLQIALDAERTAGQDGGGAAEGDVDQRLNEELERNRQLERQVEMAWAQLAILEAELERERRPRWRRIFRRDTITLPPVS